jgi:hypothetical protein
MTLYARPHRRRSADRGLATVQLATIKIPNLGEGGIVLLSSFSRLPLVQAATIRAPELLTSSPMRGPSAEWNTDKRATATGHVTV